MINGSGKMEVEEEDEEEEEEENEEENEEEWEEEKRKMKKRRGGRGGGGGGEGTTLCVLSPFTINSVTMYMGPLRVQMPYSLTKFSCWNLLRNSRGRRRR